MTENAREIPEDWFAEAFGALYPLVYAHRTVEAAVPEARFAAEQVGLSSEDRLLDLCCGNGRHLVTLKGYTSHATGLDYSPELLGFATENAGGAIPLVRGDMRALPFTNAFDVVTNFFTSFGYFQSQAENEAVAEQTAQALKPGGRFFIDYLNPDRIEATLVPRSEKETQGCVITEERWIDEVARRVNKVTTVHKNGELILRTGESVRLYRRDEFTALLQRAGLTVTKLFGDYDGCDYDENAARMIAVGHREG